MRHQKNFLVRVAAFLVIQMCLSCCVLSAQDIDENVAVNQRFIDLHSDESMVDLAYSDDK